MEGSQLNRAYKVMKNQLHYEAAFARARKNPTDKGTHGGAVMMWQNHLDTVSMGPHLDSRSSSPIRGVGQDWVAVIWRTKGQSLLIIDNH